ncbi:hydrophobin [Rhodocollybia butyracea]|uniref:Hydrophobin n=1 Tax=Rhodocollybia butyracea TaxID=206335 RepID=A0A9P5TXG2_9AGAR|nr:hydrophobin [Rhodocollybia butyracea]
MQFKLSFIAAALTTLSVTTRVAADAAAPLLSPLASCCQTVGCAATLPGASAILSLLEITLPDPEVLIGLVCSPEATVGFTGSCSNVAVCCEDNNHNGLVAVDCVPVF